jgi:hypothetical protein
VSFDDVLKDSKKDKNSTTKTTTSAPRSNTETAASIANAQTTTSPSNIEAAASTTKAMNQARIVEEREGRRGLFAQACQLYAKRKKIDCHLTEEEVPIFETVIGIMVRRREE